MSSRQIFVAHSTAVWFCVAEIASSPDETTYSEVKILKTQPPAGQSGG